MNLTGFEIIERAYRAQALSKGIRVKVRVPSAIWQRVRLAAEACEVSNEEYVCSLCRAAQSNRLKVPINEKATMGTFAESETETVWIRCPKGFDTSAANLRAVLVAGCDHTLSRHKPIKKPVEGVDYLVEGKAYTHITKKGIFA